MQWCAELSSSQNKLFMKGDGNIISNHHFLRHISRWSYYSSLMSSLRILNISQYFWNLLIFFFLILNNYIIAWKKKSMFNHPFAHRGAWNSCPSVCFCLWQWGFGVLGDKWWGLKKTLEHLSLQTEATFYFWKVLKSKSFSILLKMG